MEGSRFDEIERRLATLETHVRVAAIAGAVVGLTISTLVSALWVGFRTAKEAIDHLQRSAVALKAETDASRNAVLAVRKTIDTGVAEAIRNGKRELDSHRATQLRMVTDEARRNIAAAATAPAFALLPLQNRWVNYNRQTFGEARATRDAFSVVRLSGVVKEGTGNIATLPATYRPNFDVLATVACSEATPCKVTIGATGVLRPHSTYKWLSLDGVSFVATAPLGAKRKVA
jgi:hypothetical protein